MHTLTLFLPNSGNHPATEKLRQWTALEMETLLHGQSHFKVVYLKKEEIREWRQ